LVRVAGLDAEVNAGIRTGERLERKGWSSAVGCEHVGTSFSLLLPLCFQLSGIPPHAG